ncbi:MAG: hypothetical protein LW707_09515 [Sphingobacteriales bacterium]|jgi:hypothetical protein|nr:hypothetical protein [Sphingobacteriales bacterium]
MKSLRIFYLVSALMLATSAASAQCSMCRRVAESNMEAGEVRGKGLNTGILYLMSVPYVMAGVAGLVWWKRKRSSEKQAEA